MLTLNSGGHSSAQKSSCLSFEQRLPVQHATRSWLLTCFLFLELFRLSATTWLWVLRSHVAISDSLTCEKLALLFISR